MTKAIVIYNEIAYRVNRWYDQIYRQNAISVVYHDPCRDCLCIGGSKEPKCEPVCSCHREKRKLNLYMCAEIKLAFTPTINVREGCGSVIVSEDVVEGTTPFMLPCRCFRKMFSVFYHPERVDPKWLRAPNDIEWYKPDFSEKLNLSKSTREHVNSGGLIMRVVSERAAYLRRVAASQFGIKF